MRRLHSFVFLAGLLFASAVLHAQADNRYCNTDGIPIWIKWDVPHAYDGPAELPRKCVHTSANVEPSPLGTVSVAAGESLQAAYNSALCGTTLKLAHGATWTGPFNFAAKNCDDQHWITIASDSKVLPGEGIRVTPKLAPQMAKIITASPITVGDHLRFIGLEVTEPADGHVHYVLLETHGGNKVIIERSWFHGNPGQEMNHGVVLAGNNIAVVDSYFSDFHCIAVTGACSDAQAISGGVGQDAAESGTWKIVNNELEASGENILFGGGGGDGCPQDIEIRRNHMFKPMTWNPADPSYAGIKYITKNNFELKNGCRVLLEGNVFENNWGGFTQLGYAVLFTPKSQNNQCPNCTVTDVTFRDAYVSTAGGFVVIGSGPSDAGGWSLGNHRLSIHDVVIDNLRYPNCYGCGQMLSEIASPWGPTNPPPPSEVLSDVAIANLTLISVSSSGLGLLNIGGVPPENSSLTPQMTNVSFTNSIASAPGWGFYGIGGGSNDCMNYSKWKPVFWWPVCFVGTSPFSGNVLVGYTKGPVTDWPAGNQLSPSFAGMFVNFNGGVGGDYHLVQGSPYAGKGADIDLVNAAIAGVK